MLIFLVQTCAALCEVVSKCLIALLLCHLVIIYCYFVHRLLEGKSKIVSLFFIGFPKSFWEEGLIESIWELPISLSRRCNGWIDSKHRPLGAVRLVVPWWGGFSGCWLLRRFVSTDLWCTLRPLAPLVLKECYTIKPTTVTFSPRLESRLSRRSNLSPSSSHRRDLRSLDVLWCFCLKLLCFLFVGKR